MTSGKTAEREEKLRPLQEKLASSVEQLVTGEDWKRAIEFAARFRSRSFNNVLLLHMQHLEAYERGLVPTPYPTYVAGYKQWQQLGRQVRRGMPGYQILAPVTVRMASSKPADPDSWHRLGRGDKPGPGEVVRSGMIGVRPAYVWDVSATDGDALIPERPMPVLLRGQAPSGLHDGLVTEIGSHGFTIVDVPDAAAIGGANGLTDFKARVVSIRADMDGSARCRTAAHELGHLSLGHGPSDAEGMADATMHRGIAEVEAESFALLIGAAHGLATDDYTIPYVASWAASVPGKSPAQVVQATADRVCRTASQVLARLETTQVADGIPEGLHGADRDVSEDHDHAVPSTSPLPVLERDAVGRQTPAGPGQDEATGWQAGANARLADIGTGLRETVTLAAVHDDDTVTVLAADGRTGRVPASRLTRVGAYEPETRPVSVTETNWRRALDELDVTCDRLEERISPLDPQQWRDRAYELARQLDRGETVLTEPAGQGAATERVLRPGPTTGTYETAGPGGEPPADIGAAAIRRLHAQRARPEPGVAGPRGSGPMRLAPGQGL